MHWNSSRITLIVSHLAVKCRFLCKNYKKYKTYYKRVNSHILYPILLYATPPDCNKVENGYKTLENPIGVTVATFTAH